VLAGLVDDGLAILLVDHDIPFMLGLCKVVFVLDYGVMIASGTPEAVERNPLVRAAYLGDEEEPGLSGEGH
jgi:ABC-type branched-subunit amino acid transport system ATPase component